MSHSLGRTVTRRTVLIALIGSSAAVASCGGSPAPQEGVPIPDGPRRDLRAWGAVGDGRTDDTLAIQRALASLKQGDTLVVPAGAAFLHTDVLTVRTPGVRITGSGRLVAGNESRSSLQVRAGSVLIDGGLTLAVPTTTRRWDSADQHRLHVDEQQDVTLRDVTVEGSAAAGFFLAGTSQFVLDRVRVQGSRADGIHMTQGTRDGIVRDADIQRSGDDGVAVVSYLHDASVCRRITVIHPSVADQTGGRGISAVGAEDVNYIDIDIRNSAAAAVYVACEGSPYFTHPTRRVQVRGGQIAGANTDTSIDQGAVLVYSGRNGGSVSDVLITDLTISRTRATASRQVAIITGANATFDQARLQNLAVIGGPATVFASNAMLPAGTTRGFTVDGKAAMVGP